MVLITSMGYDIGIFQEIFSQKWKLRIAVSDVLIAILQEV